jgi:hypothetical protein
VVVTATVNGTAYRDTLALTRLQTGVYETAAKTYPGAALYTVSPLGIGAVNIIGDRTFTVRPRPAAWVLFTGVAPLLTSGQAQARFRATLRDQFQNLTDNVQVDSTTIVQLTQVTVSMSTDATLDDSTRQVSAGVFTMQRTSLGVFLADAHPAFTEAGNYALGVQGVPSTSGTAAFTVRPNVDYRIVFENVPDTLVAGDSLRNVVVRYFDRNDNPTDNSLGRVVYSRSGGSSTATVSMVRTGEGIYALNATQATLSGNYTMSVSGIASVNYEGNRRFVLRSQIPISAVVTISTGAMTSKGANVNLTVQYRDIFGNLADAPSTALLHNEQITSSVASFTLQKSSAGVYTTRATVTEPGMYNITFSVTRPATTTNTTTSTVPTGTITPRFNINPGIATRAVFYNVPAVIDWAMPL